jgi:SAM-dependent methyltransferase
MNNALIESQIAMKTGGISNTSLIVDQWPESELEHLECCPVCGDKERTVLFSGLVDTVAHVAPGKWTLWHCVSCGSGYLDPRPLPSSIGRAYENYYTHQGVIDEHDGMSSTPGGWVARQRRALSNDYINRRYGYNFTPQLLGGALMMRFFPKRRTDIDYGLRHLPTPSAKGARLLDVGCGNGRFLCGARKLGYEIWGLEPDPQAASAARELGFTIHVGGLPDSGLPEGYFAHITLNHVFEHLHYPERVVQEIFRLLEPGGRVWLRFPNIDSQGLRRFGENWRGLEPPRHLVLPSAAGLLKLLEQTGYVDIRLLPPQQEAKAFFIDSLKLVEGRNPFLTEVPVAWGSEWEDAARHADRQARYNPELGESLTFVAYKGLA